MLILDPPKVWSAHALQGQLNLLQPTDLGINGPELEARNCAVYFPRIKKVDPETGQIGVFPACGALAGIYAATDSSRGVWKAPAGITAGVGGITGLEFNLSDDQNGQLNPIGINCLRSFPIIGPVVWGARTLRGADILSDDYKYVPVRRLTLYIEESLYRGTKFAVFEPNDETLWSQLRLSIGAFMADLARQGAFYGYAVACDKSTTTQYDIDRGIVNVRVAFAPVKPAEFIVLQIQQQAGNTAS
jgi:phage tail sheath protein FI